MILTQTICDCCKRPAANQTNGFISRPFGDIRNPKEISAAVEFRVDGKPCDLCAACKEALLNDIVITWKEKDK